MLYAAIAETSKQLVETSSRKKKVELIARLLRELAPDEHAVAARHLSGEVPYKLGIGYATVGELHGQVAPAATARLAVIEVDRRFAAIAELRGSGSGKAKRDGFGAMLAAATAVEQGFLSALVAGGRRQGRLDASVVDAIALATQIDTGTVRTAYMLAGDIGAVAAAALGEGAAGLARFGLTLFRPVLPMLAQTADTAADAIASFGGPAALELKLDGFRVQIHKDGERVRVFSRALNDVTGQVPEVVAAAAALPARRLILEGGASEFGPDGRPLPFKETMRRPG